MSSPFSSRLRLAVGLALFGLLPAIAGAVELDAASAKKRFNDRGCNACHEVGEQRIGPPYQLVALRYASEYDADPAALIDKLATKIRHGGAGAWGQVPMISNPNIDAAEAESISRWIMSLRPAARK